MGFSTFKTPEYLYKTPATLSKLDVSTRLGNYSDQSPEMLNQTSRKF